MKFSKFVLAILIPFLAFSQEDTSYVAGNLLFKACQTFNTIESGTGVVTTDQPWFNSLSQQYEISELRPVFAGTDIDLQTYYFAVFDTNYGVDEVINAFNAETAVEMAEPNYIGYACGTPNDQYFNFQWGLSKIHAEDAWEIESGISSVIVGVIDTGTDLKPDGSSPHVDLVNNLWTGNSEYGYNVIVPGDYPHDDNGHGTLVAGVIGAETNNNRGIAGLAGGGFDGGNGIRMMSIKSADYFGIFHTSFVSPGIEWAAMNDARIINMSFAIPKSQTLKAAIDYAYELGCVLIAAAGNYAVDIGINDAHVYPAKYDEIIAVASTDPDDSHSQNSNYGAPIDVCAPGFSLSYDQVSANIYSTTPETPGFYYNVKYGVPTDYGYVGGTSMSCAMVSGLAALLKSYDNNLSNNEIRNLINGTADLVEDQSHYEFAGKLGAGRINAYSALSALQDGISHPNLVYYGRDILNDPGGDGYINVSETVDIVVYLKNFWEDATSVTATLSPQDNNITVISDSVYNYGSISNRETVGGNYTITVGDNTPLGEYNFNLHIEASNYSEDLTFALSIYSRISDGFPISLEETIWAEPKIADLDGDGDKEMIILTEDGNVYEITSNNQPELLYSNAGELRSAPALGDLDSDGDLEIIFGSREGYLHILNYDGTEYVEPIDLDNSFWSSPVLADINGDHELEIIICGRDSDKPYNVFALDNSGAIIWQVDSDGPIAYSPASGDFNGDGKDDIFCLVGGNENFEHSSLIIYNGYNGQAFDEVVFSRFKTRASPSIGYINNDNYLDILITLFPIAPPPTARSDFQTFLINGEDLETVSTFWTNRIYATPIADYLESNSGLEIFMPITNQIELYNYQGNLLANTVAEEPFNILIGDLNNDSKQEMLAASSMLGTYGTIYWNALEAFDNDFENWSDFSVRNQSNSPINPCMISDINNDGYTDITAVNVNGDIYVYELNYPYYAQNNQWPEAQRDMYNSKRYYDPPFSGELETNSTIEWSGTVRISGDVTLPSSSTLNIEPGTKIIFEHGDDEKDGEDPTLPELIIRGTLNANGTENNHIEFFSYSRWYGIIAKPDAELNLDYCWIDKAEIGVEIKPQHLLAVTHQIDYCEITKCNYGIYISSNSANIQYNQIHNNSTGIYLFETEYSIYANDIYDNQDHGIYLSNSSDGEIVNNNIYSNSSTGVEGPYAGLTIYQSSPNIYGNQIYNNSRNGIILLDNSFPVIVESNLVGSNGSAIEMEEPAWDKAEILMHDISNPYMHYGHNDIVDERTYAGYLMMHSGELDEFILAQANYWGDKGPEGRLYPIEYYDYEDWDEEPNTEGIPQQMSSEEQLFFNSLEAEKQGDFSIAKNGYQQIISNYPDSIETAYSLARLYVCEQALGGDFAQLQNYYLNSIQSISDSVNFRIAENLARRCLVQQLLLNDAIIEYETIVQNPPSLVDSIYAIIDIGDIYLLQEELNNGPNLNIGTMGGTNAIPEKPELRPVDHKQFEKKKKELLALLYSKTSKNKNLNIPKYYALQQNYPNPFNPVTTIKYQLPKATKAKLEIYNILGQKVKTLVDAQQPADYYSIEWDGKNSHGTQVGSGLYIYRLIAEATDGSENFIKVRKMLLIR